MPETLLERRLQSGIWLVMLALVAWAGNSLTNLQRDVAVLQATVQTLSLQVAKLEGKLESSVTQDQAQREHERLEALLQALEERLEVLE